MRVIAHPSTLAMMRAINRFSLDKRMDVRMYVSYVTPGGSVRSELEAEPTARDVPCRVHPMPPDVKEKVFGDQVTEVEGLVVFTDITHDFSTHSRFIVEGMQLEVVGSDTVRSAKVLHAYYCRWLVT